MLVRERTYTSAEDAYSSMAADPTFSFVIRVVLHFVNVFWVIILLNTLLTLPFDIPIQKTSYGTEDFLLFSDGSKLQNQADICHYHLPCS
jgi:hypothetical protein